METANPPKMVTCTSTSQMGTLEKPGMRRMKKKHLPLTWMTSSCPGHLSPIPPSKIYKTTRRSLVSLENRGLSRLRLRQQQKGKKGRSQSIMIIPTGRQNQAPRVLTYLKPCLKTTSEKIRTLAVVNIGYILFLNISIDCLII